MMQESTAMRANYTTAKLVALVALRLLIGWHFLYEGIVKVLNPYWTSAGYLADSQWLFSGIFISMALSPTMLAVVDFVNKWGLILIGLGLMLGAFTRVVTVAAIVFVFLYYICAPPLPGYEYSIPSEGSYLIVNKTLIEMSALIVLMLFPTGRIIGVDKLIFRKNESG